MQGFDDFDDESDIGSDLDTLLGDTAPPTKGPGEEGTQDDELESFFEDLSTIDDLEGDELDDVSTQPLPVAAATPDPARHAAKPTRQKKKPPKKRGRFWGFLWRWSKRAALLGLVIWGGRWLYLQFFPTGGTPPWEIMSKPVLVEPVAPLVLEPQFKPPPVAKPRVTRRKVPRAKPKTRVPSKRKPSRRPIVRPIPTPLPTTKRPARYGIQVASCLTDSCTNKVENLLRQHGWQVRIHSQERRNELVEVISEKRWFLRIQAEDWAERINTSHSLEGFAHAVSEQGGHRVSMGSFVDLSRANRVRDVVNQRYPGQLLLNSHLVQSGYALRRLIGEGFVTRVDAEQALSRFLRKYPSYAGAFVVPL